MECTMPQSLRDAHPELCDPNNLDASVEQVFSMMLGVRCKRLPDSPVADGDAEQGTVTAVIGLGGVISGACVLKCGARAALRMVGCMAGSTFAEVDRMVEDGIGEICNMVAGAWRNRVPELAAHCGLSIPAVVFGKAYDLHLQALSLQLRCAYGFDDVRFTVAISCGGLSQPESRAV